MWQNSGSLESTGMGEISILTPSPAMLLSAEYMGTVAGAGRKYNRGRR